MTLAGSGPTALLLTAHGSRNLESNAIVARLAVACGEQLPGITVVAAYLDHGTPDPATALHDLAAAGVRDVVLAPLLFTAAFHATVDIPREVAAAMSELPQLSVRVTASMAPHPALLDVLDTRLAQALTASAAPAPDALVMASAGTSSAAARAGLEAFAAAWGRRHGLPAVAGYASAAQPDPGAAVTMLMNQGFRDVAVGSLFLGPGFLPGKARALAQAAGAVVVAEHLGDCPEVIATILDRYAEATVQPSPTPSSPNEENHETGVTSG